MHILHHSKLHTDDAGRLPFLARSGNQYVMVTYPSLNVILVEPFKYLKDTHQFAAYDVIMQRLKGSGLAVDLQILGNKCSKEYEQRMT